MYLKPVCWTQLNLDSGQGMELTHQERHWGLIFCYLTWKRGQGSRGKC